jgi:hypothetical protein
LTGSGDGSGNGHGLGVGMGSRRMWCGCQGCERRAGGGSGWCRVLCSVVVEKREKNTYFFHLFSVDLDAVLDAHGLCVLPG